MHLAGLAATARHAARRRAARSPPISTGSRRASRRASRRCRPFFPRAAASSACGAKRPSSSARFPNPDERPPLFGVALGVKDVFRVDGMPTRAGSRLPAELFAGPEAASVSALRAAGALVVGKTVSTEFAYFAPGPTRNPHAPRPHAGRLVAAAPRPASRPGCARSLSAPRPSARSSAPAPFAAWWLQAQLRAHRSRRAWCRSRRRSTTSASSPPTPRAPQLAARVLLPGFRDGDARARAALGDSHRPYLERASPEARQHLDEVAGKLAVAGCSAARGAGVGRFRRPSSAGTAPRRRRGGAGARAVVRRHRDALRAADGRAHRARPPDRRRRRLRDALADRARLRAELEETLRRADCDLWLTPAAPGPAPRGLQLDRRSGDEPAVDLRRPAGARAAGRAVDADGLPLGVQLVARLRRRRGTARLGPRRASNRRWPA